MRHRSAGPVGEASGHPRFALLGGLLLLGSGASPPRAEGWRGEEPPAGRRMRCREPENPSRSFKAAAWKGGERIRGRDAQARPRSPPARRCWSPIGTRKGGRALSAASRAGRGHGKAGRGRELSARCSSLMNPGRDARGRMCSGVRVKAEPCESAPGWAGTSTARPAGFTAAPGTASSLCTALCTEEQGKNNPAQVI